MNTEQIIDEIGKMKDRVKIGNIKGYNLELTERIVLRLDSFPECSECRTLLDEFASILQEINNGPIESLNKKYALFEKKVLLHLQKNHKLITTGYYTSIFMACGVSIGMLLGISFSQLLHQTAYIGIGLPIGIGIGLSIGGSLDAKAKKDGLVI